MLTVLNGDATAPPKSAGDKVEHLKMIQAVIARLGSNSFLLKGWSATLAAGLSALTKAGSDRGFAWIALGVVVVFGLLDAYYLGLERAYRGLYRAVAQAPADPSYDLTADPVSTGVVLRALARPSVGLLHGALAAAALAVALSS